MIAISTRNANLPQELKDLKHWGGRYKGDGRKRPAKLDGRPMCWGTATNWLSFAEVSRLAEIMFIISKDCGYVGIDCDGCRNPETGEIHPLVAKWTRRTYAEISSSGKGVKFFLKATLPETFKKFDNENVPWKNFLPGEEHVGIEIHTFQPFHLTGNRVDGSPSSIAEDEELLTGILTRFAPRPKPSGKKRQSSADGSYESVVRELDVIEELDDGAIITCPWANQHTTPGDTARIWIGPPHTFSCFHSHCGNHTWHDVRLSVDPHAYDNPDKEQEKKMTPEQEAAPAKVNAMLLSKVHQLRDLQQEHLPEMKWAIEPIMPEGLVILAGKPKMGKSWLALAIAVAVAEGGLALGRYPVEQGTVLYIDLESRKRRLQSRANKLYRDGLASEHFYYAIDCPQMGQGGLMLIEEFVKQHPDTRLIIIDTWGRFKPTSNGKRDPYDEAYEAMMPLNKFANDHGITILLVDHMKKGEMTEDPADMFYGSVGKWGATNAGLALFRQHGETDVHLFVKGHDVEEELDILLAFDHTMASWTAKGNVAEEPIAATPERQKILNLLSNFPDGLTCTEVAQKLGKSPNTVRNQLAELRHVYNKVAYENNRYKNIISTSNTSKGSKDSNTGNTSNPTSEESSLTKRVTSPDEGLLVESEVTSNPTEPASQAIPQDRLLVLTSVTSVTSDSTESSSNGHSRTDLLEGDKAELLTIGQQLGYPALDYRPGTRLGAGEGAWRKALLYVTKERLAEMIVCAAGMEVVAA